MLVGIIVGVVIIIVLLIVLVILMASTKYIGPTEVGLIIKRVEKKLPADEPIVFHKEAGYQWQRIVLEPHLPPDQGTSGIPGSCCAGRSCSPGLAQCREFCCGVGEG